MRAPIAVFLFLVACNQAPTPHKEAPAATQAATDATQTAGDDVMDECPGHAAEGSCADAKPAKADQNHFGHAFQLDRQETLTAAADRIGDKEEVVQVTGTVEAVCKKKGCWMELRDGETSAKVFTYAGDFFLPTDTAKGRKAVVEGNLKVKTMTEKFAKHLAQDQGEDPSQVSGSVKKLVLDAKSIKLL